MVLTYPGPLPRGALVRVDAPQMIWLDAGEGLTLNDQGRVVGWKARRGQMTAQPVPANAAGTARNPPCLQFVAGENGGLVLSRPLCENVLILGIIFSPDLPEPRTLLSLATADDDYSFLSMDGSNLRLAQRGAPQEVTLPVPPDSAIPLLVLVSLAKGKAQLSLNGSAAVSGDFTLPLGAAQLFIGCRNARGGMKNKLGGFNLSDVLVWPGQDLPSATPEAVALWRERCRIVI